MTRSSVLIPVFNGAETVGRAVRSVLAQHDPDFEVIVVDDGSTDGTLALLRQIHDDRLRVIPHERNRGISAARNTALGAATGEFIAFLDADDSWEPEFLVTMHAERAGRDVVVCGRTVVLPDSTTRSAHSRVLGELSGEDAALRMMTGGLTPFPWDKVIRRSLFTGVAYPEDIHRFEDQVVGVVVLSRARSVVSVPHSLIRYHVHGSSLTWGRVPRIAETERALDFLESSLGTWLSVPRRRQALLVCRTLFLMLTAQSAMRAQDEEGRIRVVSQCRQRISARMLGASLRSQPVIGAGATLLKCFPGLYRLLFTAYARRQYALD